MLPTCRRGVQCVLSSRGRAAGTGPSLSAFAALSPESTRLPLGSSQINLLTVEDGLCQINHGYAAVHRAALEAAEGIRLGPAVALHENALRSLNNLAAL